MAKGVNKVILIGNLGNNPEVRHAPSGSAVANVTIATTERYKEKQTDAMQDRTEWHRLVFFNRLAEIAGEYLHKGSKIYIEGSLRTRKWKDKDNIERATTEIVVNELNILESSARENNKNFFGQELSGDHPPPFRDQMKKTTNEFDDDIPF